MLTDGSPYWWVQSSSPFDTEEACACCSSDDNTTRVHRTDLHQACSAMMGTVSDLLPSGFPDYQQLDLLCSVGSAEPWIEPSSVISRCRPALAAYRCLKRTTCSQPWGKGEPWSNNGTERTPAQRKRKVMGSMRRAMFPHILQWSPVCCEQRFSLYCAF